MSISSLLNPLVPFAYMVDRKEEMGTDSLQEAQDDALHSSPFKHINSDEADVALEVPTQLIGRRRPPRSPRDKYHDKVLGSFVGTYIFSLLETRGFRFTEDAARLVQTEIQIRIYTAIYESCFCTQTVLGAVLYLERIFPEGIPYSGPGGRDCLEMLSRLFLMALRLGAAWFEEGMINMTFWGPKMDTTEMNIIKMELHALDLLHFNLYISPEHWNNFIDMMCAEGPSYINDDYVTAFLSMVQPLYAPNVRSSESSSWRLDEPRQFTTAEDIDITARVLSMNAVADRRGRLVYFAMHNRWLPNHQPDWQVFSGSNLRQEERERLPVLSLSPPSASRTLSAVTTSTSSSPSPSSSPTPSHIVEAEEMKPILVCPSSPEVVNSPSESYERPLTDGEHDALAASRMSSLPSPKNEGRWDSVPASPVSPSITKEHKKHGHPGSNPNCSSTVSALSRPIKNLPKRLSLSHRTSAMTNDLVRTSQNTIEFRPCSSTTIFRNATETYADSSEAISFSSRSSGGRNSQPARLNDKFEVGDAGTGWEIEDVVSFETSASNHSDIKVQKDVVSPSSAVASFSDQSFIDIDDESEELDDDCDGSDSDLSYDYQDSDSDAEFESQEYIYYSSSSSPSLSVSSPSPRSSISDFYDVETNTWVTGSAMIFDSESPYTPDADVDPQEAALQLQDLINSTPTYEIEDESYYPPYGAPRWQFSQDSDNVFPDADLIYFGGFLIF